MKRVLYLTNTEVPYRVRFFNKLAEHCDLTVVYECRKSSSRDHSWARSQMKNFRTKYLRGIKFRGENVISLGILWEILGRYDIIVVGCYNSPSQMLAILAMRLLWIPYVLNLDGEIFLGEGGLKNRMKRFFLAGAQQYLSAGEKAGESIGKAVGEKTVIPYYFSSLSEDEVQEHSRTALQENRNSTVLVVGQYFPYKGMDVALEAARLDPSIPYKFVGMGPRTARFVTENEIPENVEIVPFMQKEELEREYRNCAMLVLPTRQECWGLVINEAASFGTPIVSTWGSGAAVEFLGERYPQYLANPGDPDSLYDCICRCLSSADQRAYCDYLIEKAKQYTIENSIKAHLHVIEM